MAKWRDVKQNKRIKNKNQSIKKELFIQSSSLSARFKVFLTDSFLITTPIVYIVLYLIMGGGQEFAQDRILGWSIIFIIHFTIIAIFWLKNGQTPGLKAYESKLVDYKTKERISVIQVIIRYFITIISIISIFALFLPFLRKDRRTIQDIVAKTIIIDFKD